jgi:HK97 family phage major capsid protein
MVNDKVLRERRKDSLDKADAIVALCESENNRGMTEAEKGEFDAHLAEVTRVDGELEGLKRAFDAKGALDAAKKYDVPAVAARATSEPPARNDENGTHVEVRENSYRAYQPGDAIGAIVSARMRFGQAGQRDAIAWGRTTYGENSPQVRAMQQSVFTSGGAFLKENFVVSEFIDLLRAAAAVRKAGARVLQLVNGTATIPKLVTGATVYWQGNEGDNITKSEPTTGQVVLAEKKQVALVPISNDLRRNSSLTTERIVRDDLIAAAANAEDIAFLKGSGLAGEPKGIYNWIPAAGKANQTGTALADLRTDIRKAKNRLDNNNVPSTNRAWFMHARAMNYIGWDLVDGNGNFAFPSMQNAESASLGGDKVYRDNNISITISGTQSEHYYVEMSECFIGDAMELELEVIENATYDVSGTLRSGVSRDESVIRLIRKVDFGMRHVESAFVVEAVTIGS